MDFTALVLSVEITRRHAGSALPHAPVQRPDDRWRRARAAMRRVARR